MPAAVTVLLTSPPPPSRLRLHKVSLLRSRCHWAPLPAAKSAPPPSLPLTAASLAAALPLLFCAPAFASGGGTAVKASGFGLKIAAALRQSGWADEAIVVALAAMPVLELRAAIPVGYWMNLHPLRLTALAVVGNMVPVPLIVLYLRSAAAFLSKKIPAATAVIDMVFDSARKKAGPVEEFRWLGLMLFVAVPFPGTGAWSGAIIASILGMPFWSAVTANFFGVVIAGLLVNLLMNLGVKHAVAAGSVLFLVSTVMWSVLRSVTSPPPPPPADN